MRKLKITGLSFTAVLVLSQLLHSCKWGNKVSNPDPVVVNHAFETDPPLADDVIIEKIEGDAQHVLLTAHFAKDKLTGNTLAINLDGEQVVLRDDGTEGDKTAGDGTFTLKVQDT
ncbi:MAG TPA: choice-of-anchor X domain-containing protein, partial [Chitinophagales bacterium]|nr:choice-of-anchor X domain-containing protein [Chitinophagales bacterium]